MIIGIIYLGVGNIYSLIKAINNINNNNNNNIIIVNNIQKINKCDKIIFPGQGAINNYYKNLISNDFLLSLRIIIKTKYFLGICLGEQILFGENKEGGFNGLGIIKGKINYLKKINIKLPHIGWNKVYLNYKHTIYKITDNNKNYLFFSNSYYLNYNINSFGRTFHNIYFSSFYILNNIFLVQFHPEISGSIGLNLIRNFINYI